MNLLTIFSKTLILMTLLSVPVMSSKGIFEIHIKKYFLYQSLNLSKCCSKSDIPSKDCSSQCKIFMEICLSIYQKVPHRYECDIGENMIVTDILGDEKLSSNSNRDYSIKVHERWMKNFNILVKIKHRDDLAKKEKIIVTLSSSEENVKPSSDWITKQLSNPKDHFLLLVSFRYSCSEYFYGEKCDNYCKPSESDYGHYNCSSLGHKICHNGYSGNYCDKVFCKQKCVYGTCIGPNQCRCFTGWTGDSCDTCVPYPGCVNGGCRQDDKRNELLPLTCDCKKGWGGMFCNIDLNYCSNNPNVCLNAGECQNFGDINTNQQYRCVCKPGFQGTHCEKLVTNCLVRGCLNGGICQIKGEQNVSKCICKDAFYGDRCQFNMTSCAETPCIGSNSMCYPDTKLGFKCDCATGFIGRNCEIDKDECFPNPCLNGGMCIDRASGFQCVCPVGFSGHRCQVNKNDCQRLSCMNGARCMDKANRIDCECTSGWSGLMCSQNINECAINSPCENGGICEDSPGSYRCLCRPSWSGVHCNFRNIHNNTFIKDKKCLINPCENGGNCFLSSKYEEDPTKGAWKSTGGPYYCVCPPGFTGRLCKLVIVANGTFDDVYDNSLTTPFISFSSKRTKSPMTLINLIIISIGVPLIIIIILVLGFIWSKRSKKVHKDNSSSTYQNNIVKNHNFSNNANIMILNNHLDQSKARNFGSDTAPLSRKLNNHFSNKNSLNNSNKESHPNLPLYTYKCSLSSLSPCSHPRTDPTSSVLSNLMIFPLKSSNINGEKDQFIGKSFSSINDRDGEPESIYQNSSPYRGLNKSNLKLSLDSNINSQVEPTFKALICSESTVPRPKRKSYMSQGMCSSENSLLEAQIDHNLRAAISQQIHQPSAALSYEANYCEVVQPSNFRTFRQLHHHHHNIEPSWPVVNCNLSPDNPANSDYKKHFKDNTYVLYYSHSVMPQKINYNLISHPNFRETSCFMDSAVICPSMRSVRTDSTIIDDSGSLNI